MAESIIRRQLGTGLKTVYTEKSFAGKYMGANGGLAETIVVPDQPGYHLVCHVAVWLTGYGECIATFDPYCTGLNVVVYVHNVTEQARTTNQYAVLHLVSLFQEDSVSDITPEPTIETLNASFTSAAQSAGLNQNSAIYAYKYKNLVFVSGYLNVSGSEIAANTVIANVSGVNAPQEVFTTSGSNNDKLLRMKLTVIGNVMIESKILTNNWYSFSFVTYTSN